MLYYLTAYLTLHMQLGICCLANTSGGHSIKVLKQNSKELEQVSRLTFHQKTDEHKEEERKIRFPPFFKLLFVSLTASIKTMKEYDSCLDKL